MHAIMQSIKALFSVYGYDVIRKPWLAELVKCTEQVKNFPPALKLYNELPFEKQQIIAPFLPYSKSQLSQDLFALSELGDWPHERYFVEFGATDGVCLSNTHLLETRLGWNGIVAEPAKVWQDRLKQNRHCCIDFRCVSSESGKQLEFVQPDYPEHSGIVRYADNGDVHSGGENVQQKCLHGRYCFAE